MHSQSGDLGRRFRIAVTAILIVGTVVRGSVFLWSQPWTPHHPDEDILPLEALALWEGVTPREVGWPGSTTRLTLSAVHGVQWVVARGGDAWRLRSSPDQALETITTWIGDRYRRPASLYKVGRALSLFTGVLQLCATAWAAAVWFGPLASLIATL